MIKANHIRAITIILLLYFPISQTLSASLLVVYPEAPEPYREAFEQMASGIARTTGALLQQKAITATTSREEFGSWLIEGRDKTVVLLGQKALSFYEKSEQSRRDVFLSGVNALPGQIPLPGISLSVDPAIYLQTLHELLPDVRHVVMYYNIREEPWLVPVKKAATDARISIEAIGVADAFDVIRRLGTTFETLDPKTTALWFGNNTIALNGELIYPYVLEQAWDRRIAVFSDTIAHVKLGFLFALYPDYAQIGAELGTMIRQGATPATLRFSRAGQLALNARTARHLGIVPGSALIRRAKPLFPEP
ncbi:MAG: ABC transporter substrate binding protein [Albidovulum sp.]